MSRSSPRSTARAPPRPRSPARPPCSRRFAPTSAPPTSRACSPDRPVPSAGSFAAGGAGLVDVGASATGEVAASATSLSFGPRASRTLTVRNVSTRRLIVNRSRRAEGARCAAPPRASRRAFGAHSRHRACTCRHRGHARARPARRAAPPRPVDRRADGAARAACSRAQRSTTRASRRPTRHRRCCSCRQAASTRGDGVRIEPVSQLDVLLYTAAGGFVGMLARERDLLPGTYSFGDHRPVAHRLDARARPLPVAPGRLADAWRCSQQADRLLRDRLRLMAALTQA